MSELSLWRKQEFDRMRQEIDLLFKQFRRGFGLPHGFLGETGMFSTSLSETEDSLVLRAEFPGVTAENIQLSVTDDMLRIEVKTSEDSVDQGANFQNIVKQTRSFSRSISFPCRVVVDDVKATFQNNILEIKLPKCRPEAARGIAIEVK
jgi:HSP20 family protein